MSRASACGVTRALVARHGSTIYARVVRVRALELPAERTFDAARRVTGYTEHVSSDADESEMKEILSV